MEPADLKLFTGELKIHHGRVPPSEWINGACCESLWFISALSSRRQGLCINGLRFISRHEGSPFKVIAPLWRRCAGAALAQWGKRAVLQPQGRGFDPRSPH